MEKCVIALPESESLRGRRYLQGVVGGSHVRRASSRHRCVVVHRGCTSLSDGRPVTVVHLVTST